jgi:Na+-transporting methylmalonyl-CoA/oxaloacetate decarboxylase gamma subunit
MADLDQLAHDLNLEMRRRENPVAEPTQQFLSALNRAGVANVLGAPVDLANWALDKIGLPTHDMHPLGSKSIENFLVRTGSVLPAELRREGYAQSAGDLAGLALSTGTGLASVGARLNTAAQLRGGAPPPLPPGFLGTVKRLPRTVAEMSGRFAAGGVPWGARTRPTVPLARPLAAAAPPARAAGYLALEGTLGALAGAGGEKAARQFGELARPYGELGGALSPAAAAKSLQLSVLGAGRVAASLPLMHYVTKFTGNVVRGFRPGASRARAQERIVELAEDPQAVAAAIEREARPVFPRDEDLLPEAIPALSPLQRVGDERLLALERLIMSADDGRSQDAQVQAVRAILNRSLNDLARGQADDALVGTDAETQSMAYLSVLIDARIRLARESALRELENVAPGVSNEQINRIVRTELQRSLDDSKAQEDQLWTAVDKGLLVGTGNVFRAYDRLLANLSTAEADDMPQIATRFLGKDEGGDDVFDSTVSLKELQGLRSKLLEIGRKARLAGNDREAWLAGEISEAILDDFAGAAGKAGQGAKGAALRTALQFTRTVKEVFEKGPLAAVLGETRRGPRVPSGRTLETLGVGGAAAREYVDAMAAGRRTGAARLIEEAQKGGAGAEAAADEYIKKLGPFIEAYLRNLYLHGGPRGEGAAVRDGFVTEAGSRQFMNRHQAVLDQFPRLKAQFERSNVVGRVVPPEKVVRGILDDPDPARVIQAYLRQPGADRDGLRMGIIDYVVRGQRPSEGEPVLHGNTMLLRMGIGQSGSRAQRALKEILTADEYKRLFQIAMTAKRIDTAVGERGAAVLDNILSSPVSGLMEIGARVAGAQMGRKVASWTGGGTVQTPGIFSQATKRLAGKIKDPAARLLIDAVTNQDAFDILMTPLRTPLSIRTTQKQVHAWLLGVLRESGEAQEDNGS